MSGALPPARRALVRMSAALAAGDGEALRRELEEAGRKAEAPAVEECLVQSYLFLGFPAALNALALWREASGRPAPRALDESPAGWEARGEEVCRKVYGDRYPALRRNIARLHPEMDRWMVAEGYGKVLGRPGLPLVERELCIVAVLAALDAPAQLHAHLRGALEVGAPPADVEAVLAEVRTLLPPERARAAGAVWGEVRDRAAGGRGDPAG